MNDDQAELTPPPVPASAAPEPPAASAPAAEECRFIFTGSGKEYFRIWIVNLALTVATLGIYSAWAKVRRLQYFDRNTVLAGAGFDFHGDPRAILKGRVLGVALLGLYHYAYGFSLAFGVTVAGVLLVAMPYLLRSALRFRLANTSYRGLALGFSGSVPGAYLTYLPMIATVLLPGVAVALWPRNPLSFTTFLLYLGWPLMHGAAKRYQHAHLLYGAERSRYAAPVRSFLVPYLCAVGLCIAGMIALMFVLGVAAFAVGVIRRGDASGAVWLPALSALLSGYLAYLMAGPYLQSRINNLVWPATSFEGVEIRSELSARAFARLLTWNAVLTIVTLGLYRPFAVVRVYRYRLACASLLAQGGFERIAAGAVQRSGAGGDAVAELLGFDLSW